MKKHFSDIFFEETNYCYCYTTDCLKKYCDKKEKLLILNVKIIFCPS